MAVGAGEGERSRGNFDEAGEGGRALEATLVSSGIGVRRSGRFLVLVAVMRFVQIMMFVRRNVMVLRRCARFIAR